MPDPELLPGAVVWGSLDPIRGREQGGHRPLLVVASRAYIDIVSTLVIVLPITSVNRGWPNHVRVSGNSGLDVPSWIMTEQPRTIARDRISGVSGLVSTACLNEARMWLFDFLRD